MKKYGFFCMVAVVAWHSSLAQDIGPSIINSTGGSATIGSNTYEWSIGEGVAIHTATAGNTVVTHGVLQPIVVSDDTSQNIGNTPLAAAQIKVFPNPTESSIYIQPTLLPNAALSYTLYDLQGRVLQQEDRALPRGNEKVSINIGYLAAGGYVLRVICTENNRKYHNNFNIQKL